MSKMKKFIKFWWKNFRYSPNDPKYYSGGNSEMVAIGGGSGLSVLISGTKKYFSFVSAVVAVTDDGASSGKIRKKFEVLPPGDVRKCIAALANNEEVASEILNFRFEKGSGAFSGHTLGNIWLLALTKHYGSFEKAIELSSEVFALRGKILPVTYDDADLGAKYLDGSEMIGESNIPRASKKIESVFLTKKVKPNKNVIEAIGRAGVIVVGPGSLYTSILPNLLVPGVISAIKRNKEAVKIFVCNCSTERGETEGYSVEDHLAAVFKHTKTKLFDYCLVNSKIIKRSNEESELGKINNITTESDKIGNIAIVREDLINIERPLYHDSEKLAKAIVEIFNKHKSV